MKPNNKNKKKNSARRETAKKQSTPKVADTVMENDMDITPEVVEATPAAEEKKSKKAGRERRESRISTYWLRFMVALALVIVVGYFGFATVVREGESAVILRFGAPRAEITEAGMYFRLPWPFETVVTYENRLQYLESNYLETTTKDNRNIIVQSYALWQVKDPLHFHNSVGAQGTVDNYIKDQIFSATNSVLGAYNLTSLVSLDKEAIRTEEIQAKIFEIVKANCEANYGIIVTDVSILRISLPDTNLESVFEQMRAARQKEIDTILANAMRDADKITSDAEADASEIIANGEIEAAKRRAETEKEVAAIYAAAQEQNLELYKFLKELDTLVSSVGTGTVLVVDANSYPFNVLLEYSDILTDESDETVVKDLNYILSQLPETDRIALTDAVYDLINQYNGTGAGGTTP